jgi:hypothetical protein
MGSSVYCSQCGITPAFSSTSLNVPFQENLLFFLIQLELPDIHYLSISLMSLLQNYKKNANYILYAKWLHKCKLIAINTK